MKSGDNVWRLSFIIPICVHEAHSRRHTNAQGQDRRGHGHRAGYPRATGSADTQTSAWPGRGGRRGGAQPGMGAVSRGGTTLGWFGGSVPWRQMSEGPRWKVSLGRKVTMNIRKGKKLHKKISISPRKGGSSEGYLQLRTAAHARPS